eukprot:gene10397-19094_t
MHNVQWKVASKFGLTNRTFASRPFSLISFTGSCRKCSALRRESIVQVRGASLRNASASSSHVSLQSGLRSSEIETLDLSDGSKSYNNTKYAEEHFEEEDIDEIGVKSGVEEVKAPERKQKKRTKNPLPSLTLDGRQLTFVEETKVTAEVDVLMKHNRAAEAFQLFNKHRRRGHKFSVENYNQLLHCFANCGTWLQVDILLHSMVSQGVKPDIQTYAAVIEACWKMGETTKLEQFVKQMGKDGLCKEHIFHKCVLTKGQVSAITSALKSVDPDFKPVPPDAPARTKLPNNRLLNPMMEPITEQVEDNSVFPDSWQDNLHDLFEQQLQNEIKGFVTIPSIERKGAVSEKDGKRKQLYIDISEDWRKSLQETIEKEIANGMLGKDIKYSSGKTLQHKFIPYLSLLDPKDLSEIVVNEILPILCSQPQGVSVNFICRHLGGLIHSRYAMKCKIEAGVVEKVREIYTEYGEYAVDIDKVSKDLPRSKWYEIERKAENLASLKVNAPIWPYTVKVLVAGVLIDLLIKVAKVNTEVFNGRTSEIVSALTHGYSSFEGRRFGILKMHPAVARIYKSYLSNQGNIVMETEKVPMLVPPRPWTSIKEGAFLVYPVPFVRTIMERYQLKDLNDRDDQGELNAIFDCLNFLGTTCWRINTKILDMMIAIFNDKGDRHLEIFGPDLPPVPKIKSSKDMTDEERQAVMRERRAVKKSNHEIFALRMDLLYKLSVANHLREKIFWLPGNVDFRGRVYPVPPHCAHMGNDVARGMLLFGRGRPLGEDGLDWLKVHLVNLHGSLKKASLKERIDFADEKMDEITDSADNPLDGRKWWQAGDEPWQCLAICTEITNAIRSPDPTKYVSYLPVHQDGSCNGMQHYASMGHDEYGAIHVNVKPCEKPQDLYGEVANLVEKKRAADAAEGNALAKQLEGKVNRKVVKQTVMTIVYGVTFVGGRLQIEKQLKELDVPDEILFKGSSYLVHQVFRSIGELFKSARKIQDWLNVAATQISLTGHCVSWVTPLGLPITQPYHKETTEEVQTPVQNVALTTMFDPTKKPNLSKQKGGFAPNFIHSLDSCHMMLTSLFCQRARLTFASVHDSFWTHPQTVPMMNKICREQFLSLHNEPILEDLRSHFEAKFGNLNETGETVDNENFTSIEVKRLEISSKNMLFVDFCDFL